MQISIFGLLVTQAVKGKAQTIGFLGLTFKPGTDDLRESPTVELVERLIGKGYRLLLYDENVSLDCLMHHRVSKTIDLEDDVLFENAADA